MSFIYDMTWTGETGGVTHLTSTGLPAPPALPAMEEAARTTSATKVRRTWMGDRRTQEPFFPSLYPVFVILLEDDSSGPPQGETEENNLIESEAPHGPQKPWSRPTPFTQAPVNPLQKNEVVNTQQMCKLLFLLFILDLVSSENGGRRICFKFGRCTWSHGDDLE